MIIIWFVWSRKLFYAIFLKHIFDELTNVLFAVVLTPIRIANVSGSCIDDHDLQCLMIYKHKRPDYSALLCMPADQDLH